MWLGQQDCTSLQLGSSIMLFATLHAPGGHTSLRRPPCTGARPALHMHPLLVFRLGRRRGDMQQALPSGRRRIAAMRRGGIGSQAKRRAAHHTGTSTAKCGGRGGSEGAVGIVTGGIIRVAHHRISSLHIARTSWVARTNTQPKAQKDLPVGDCCNIHTLAWPG